MGTRRSEGLVAASIVLVLIIADVKMSQIYSYSMSKPAVFSLLLCVLSARQQTFKVKLLLWYRQRAYTSRAWAKVIHRVATSDSSLRLR